MVFQVGYTDEGKLQVVVVDIYIDGGFTYSCFTMLNKVFANMDHGKNLNIHLHRWRVYLLLFHHAE